MGRKKEWTKRDKRAAKRLSILRKIDDKYSEPKKGPKIKRQYANIMRNTARFLVDKEPGRYRGPDGLAGLAKAVEGKKDVVLGFFDEKKAVEMGWMKEGSIKPKEKVTASQLKAEMEAAKKRGLLK